MTALFVVIVVEQWQEQKSHFPAILGAVSGIAWLLLLGPDSFIVPALCTCMAILLLARKSVVSDDETEKASGDAGERKVV